MHITEVEPSRLSEVQADDVAHLVNAADKVDAPHRAEISGEHFRLRVVHGWDGSGAAHLLLARDGSGALTGYAELDFPHWDNQHLAFVDIVVHPDRRRRGVATTLLDAALERIRAADRTLLMADAWVDNPGCAFAERHGMAQASVAAQRRLYLDRLDQPRLDALLQEATSASTDYELIAIEGAAPEHMLEDLVAVFDAINDAPLDDLALERDQFPIARLRGYDAAHSARRQRLYRLVARRRSDGAAAGHTIVVVEELRPQRASQADTTVVREHRGHRLGFRLKLEMLRWLRSAEPQVTQVDTWNSVSNTHMIAVNDAMGHVVVGTGVTYQKRL